MSIMLNYETKNIAHNDKEVQVTIGGDCYGPLEVFVMPDVVSGREYGNYFRQSDGWYTEQPKVVEHRQCTPEEKNNLTALLDKHFKDSEALAALIQRFKPE